MSLNSAHVDSTTHNFTLSFHASSLSNGYHLASRFYTRAKANPFRNKYQCFRTSKTISKCQLNFSYQLNLVHSAPNFELLKTHGDIELNPGPTKDVTETPSAFSIAFGIPAVSVKPTGVLVKLLITTNLVFGSTASLLNSSVSPA